MEYRSTILIVDDSEAGRIVLDQLLSDSGYDLEFAENGFEALEKLEKQVPDLVLLDVMMPGMNGFEVCKKIRENDKLKELPVLMVSMLDDQESRLQGIESGADDFINKPFNLAELEMRIKTITRLNRYRKIIAERKKLDWVIDNTLNAMLVVDKNNNILFLNKKARNYLDIREESDVSNLNFFDLVDLKFNKEPHDKWEKFESFDEANFPDLYLVLPETDTNSAQWLQFLFYKSPAGVSEQRLIVLTDVTKQIQESRIERTFHGLILHKLRTPMNSLSGVFELIGNFGDEMSREEIIELINNARTSFNRLNSQIESIVNYVTNPTTAKSYGEIFDFESLPDMLEQIAKEHSLQPVDILGLQGVMDYSFTLSSSAFRWITNELALNAKKFHPEHNPKCYLQLSKTEDSIVIVFGDDGINLSPEQLENAWRPYYQGEKYFTGETPGVGIGLSTIASYIWEAGGTFSLYNRKDSKGVEIELILPIKILT
jgi:DNA-binding response OmpR family regulator